MNKFNLKEHIAKNKATAFSSLNKNPQPNLKESKLRTKIREMIMEEMNLDVEDTTDEYDFLAEASPLNDPRTQQVIDMLIDMEVDGETMEYILKQVGMEDQMANQLVNYPTEYEASLNEEEEEDEEDEEIDTEEIDTEEIDTDEIDPTIKSVQDALSQAQGAAQSLGDEKLTDQIGNTITYFTRAHISNPQLENIRENTQRLFPILNRILK
jgi:hypothetical protein